MKPVLYGNRESGHSYKICFALTLLCIDYEFRDVELFLPRDRRREDWQAASRFGEVPVLVVDRPIVQSNAILLYLARTYNALGWERDPDALTEWLFWEANRIGLSLANIRFYRLSGKPLSADVDGWLQGRLDSDLATLDDILAHSRFLMGDAISAADISCSGYMFFADQIPLDLAHWPNVFRWLADIKAIPLWSHPYKMMM